MRTSSCWRETCHAIQHLLFISVSPTYSLFVLNILMAVNKEEMKQVTLSLPLLKIRLNYANIMQILMWGGKKGYRVILCGGNNMKNKHFITNWKGIWKSQNSCANMVALFMLFVWFSEISIKNILQTECVIWICLCKKQTSLATHEKPRLSSQETQQCLLWGEEWVTFLVLLEFCLN